jgi:dihydrofolate synthase / folylpolyglutamate synthase
MAAYTSAYKETLAYLYEQLPMFQRIGAAAYRKDLTNIRALVAHMGHPEKDFPSVHIAGTNGKGSTAHMLAAILQAHGLKTGLYVSPHYRDFRERIKIDGRYIGPKAVVNFVARNKELIETIRPSFFEITVAMAFDHFARRKVDVAVIETGLGGRLDSTNVIRPLMSVITNIGFDHMDFLGVTLAHIAFEKAGIIKSGVPAVIGEYHPETQPVFEQKAKQERSPLFWASKNYKAEVISETPFFTTFDVWENGELKYKDLEVEAGGPYQRRNLVTVLQAWSVLQLSDLKAAWDEEKLRYGLKHLKKLSNFIGRWHQIGERPTIICDSAHNEDGFALVTERLRAMPCKRLHFVIGFSADKEVEKLLAYFPQHAEYYFAKANIPRGMDASLLQERAAAAGLPGKAYDSVRKAFQAAKRRAAPDDLIYVGGSIFVVGEVI